MIAPRPFGRIISAHDAGLWRDAGEAVAAAGREAAMNRARAAEALAAERAALETSLQEAAALQTARALAEAAASAQLALHAMRTDIAATIAAAVRRVVGGLDVGEAVAAAAREALAELAGRHGVTVHVHPSCAPRVREVLAPWGDGARVVADDGLPDDACTLETEAGIVRAGLCDQLGILAAALEQAALSHA
jgi:flagellar biosynthesis/type III secretory pathway protein FliH